MNLWTKEDLVAATGGEMHGEWQVSGLSIDSREIAQGDLFIALKAARDGHEFVAGALKKGAAGALVSYIPEGCEDANLLIVENVETALERMGIYRRAQVSAKIVAVTGSAGKTSTKEMLLTALSHFGKTHASVKSFNNHWGVPLTLARMPLDCEFGIFEIGMNHPGEIEPLVSQVGPDVAIITNIAPVHLEGFENEQGIAFEKSTILKGLNEKGLGLINGDMKFRDFVAKKASEMSLDRVEYFGFGSSNEIVGRDVEVAAGSTCERILMAGSDYQLELPVAGEHHAMNALAVAGVLRAFDVDVQLGLNVLKLWQAPEGRGQSFTISLTTGTIILIDESYNANPLSMRAAIDAFLLTPAKRHIALLGDMRELGLESENFHAELATYKGTRALDRVHVVGEEMRALHENLQENQGVHFDNKDQAIDKIDALFEDGDAVLVKASLGIGLGRVVDALKEMGQSAPK